MASIDSLSHVVGRNLTRIRGNKSESELAQSIARFGTTWTSTDLVMIESGERPLSTTELFFLCTALGVGMQEMLAGEGEVWLSPNMYIDLKRLRDMAISNSLPPGFEVITIASDLDLIKGLAPGQYEEDASPDAIYAKAIAERQEAERETAGRLGVRPQVVVAAAFGLWGHSLTEEAAARLEGRSEAPVSRESGVESVQSIHDLLDSELLARLKEVSGADRP